MKWPIIILPVRLYPVSGIPYRVEYIIKIHKIFSGNPLIKMCFNKIENRSTFAIQLEYFLEILMPETMKLFKSTENNINKDKNGGFNEVILACCNTVNNDQQDSKFLFTFVSNKSYGQ